MVVKALQLFCQPAKRTHERTMLWIDPFSGTLYGGLGLTKGQADVAARVLAAFFVVGPLLIGQLEQAEAERPTATGYALGKASPASPSEPGAP
jgi:hypothetical protein